ncbi:hypothetical protein MIAR_10890 [Microbacterium arabinogalactanolyticum]|nr:hypothetical protein MIAR_10890 [Microbacterium arabinogalactanolyticum]
MSVQEFVTAAVRESRAARVSIVTQGGRGRLGSAADGGRDTLALRYTTNRERAALAALLP